MGNGLEFSVRPEDGETAPVCTASMAVEAPDAPGARIDRYVIVDRLGSGAMGVVLRAFDPRLSREVALKRIRPEAMGAQAEVRLEREAQAMARLSHPNVVAVYDVHAGSDGLFVAMEYVRGPDLGAWLRGTRAPEEIMALFAQAGRGLAAAHQAGLVHRDFKPANVLVDEDDAGRPRARVTDFGLARATSAPASQSSVGESSEPSGSIASDALASTLTAADTVMGTPRYMAPEQHLGHPVEAAADQYAFCVALWEALTGRPPFTGKRDVLERRKLAGPPRWPNPPGVPAMVGRVLARGLAPNEADRWPSMLVLLRALRPASATQRRIRWSMAAAVALCGVGGLGYAAVEERRAAKCASISDAVDDVWNPAARESIGTSILATDVAYAEEALAKVEPILDGYAQKWKSDRAAACRAHDELSPAVATAIESCFDERLLALDSLVQAFGQSRPETIRHAVSAARSLPRLERCGDERWLAASAAPTSDIDEEQLGAVRTKSSRAKTLERVGLYETGLEVTQAALKDAEAIGWLPLTIELRIEVAKLLERTGRFQEAADAYEQGYVDAVRIGDDQRSGEAAAALTYTVGFHLSDHDAAALWGELAQVALDRAGETHGLPMADYLHGASMLHHAAGRYAEARDHAERSLAIRRSLLDPDDPRIAFNLEVIAGIAFQLGDYDESRRRHEEALQIRMSSLGALHPDVAMSLMNLGNVAAARGRNAAARRYYDRALESRRRSLGKDHPAVAEVLNNIAVLISDLGELEEAAEHYREALRIVEVAFGPEHPHVAMVLNNLGAVADDQGKNAEAVRHYERALEIRAASLGPDHASTAATQYNLALVIMQLGKPAQARELVEQALATMRKALGEEHPNVASMLEALGRFSLAADQPAEALPLFERAKAIRVASGGATSPELAWSLAGIGEAKHALGDARTATLHLERALELRGDSPEEPVERGLAQFALARALADLGEQESRALELARSAVELVRAPEKAQIEAWLCAHDSCAE